MLEGDDPGGRAFALIHCPHPVAFRQLMCPHPGEFAHLCQHANARGLARGGWALLELADALVVDNVTLQCVKCSHRAQLVVDSI